MRDAGETTSLCAATAARSALRLQNLFFETFDNKPVVQLDPEANVAVSPRKERKKNFFTPYAPCGAESLG